MLTAEVTEAREALTAAGRRVVREEGLHDVMQGRAGDPEAVAQTQPEQTSSDSAETTARTLWSCQSAIDSHSIGPANRCAGVATARSRAFITSSGPCISRTRVSRAVAQTVITSSSIDSTPAGRRRRRRPSTSARRPAGTRWRAWPTPRNPYPSREAAAGRGRRAGDPRGRPVPRGCAGDADGQPAALVDGPRPGTRRRSTPGPGHTGCRRRRARRRARSGPAGRCLARVPGRARREAVPAIRGRARQAAHRSVADPRKALVATQGLRLSGVPMGAVSTATPRPGELSGRSSSPRASRREGQKSADPGGHQHEEDGWTPACAGEPRSRR